MTDLSWTSAQLAAIGASGASILVSAGAGSGKTAVLAERCAHLVAEGRPPCPVDHLLVVTFTDAAALQMRQRIADALRKRLSAKPANSWLQQQLALLDTAWISTIHSFCRRILNRHFARVDLDPLSPVMEVNDAELLRQETARRIFDDFADRQDAAGEAFHTLLAHYGGPSEDRLIEWILALDAFLTSVPDAAAWTASCLEHFTTTTPGVLPPFWFEQLVKVLSNETAQQRNVVAEHLAALRRGPGVVVKSIECLEAFQDALNGWLASLIGSPDTATIDRVCREEIATYQFPKPPAVIARQIAAMPKEQAHAFEAAVQIVKDVRERFKQRIQKTYGRFSTSDWAEGIARTRGHVAAFLSLVKEVRKAYQGAKRDLGVVDFADLEKFTLDLLRDEDGGVAEQLRDKFQHVLVDEFQDVNQVQAEILRLVSREAREPAAGNLFAVGDVKQCIYRFRLAEPRLFLERRDAFARIASEPPGPSPLTSPSQSVRAAGILIDLVKNFRSDKPVIEAINAVFERLMAPDLGGIAYDEHAKLTYGPDRTRPSAGIPVELHQLDTVSGGEIDDEAGGEKETSPSDAFDWEQIEREAYVVADRVKTLAAEGIPYRDMVVLLRTFQANAGLFVRTLSRLGVPVFADVSGGFFQATEIQDCLSLLAVLDNPQQDIPLATVLRSPLVGEALTDSQLVEVAVNGRRARPGLPFHAAVRHYVQNGSDAVVRSRLAAIEEHIARWRDRIRRRSLADVLWEIYEESGYFAYVAGLRAGPQRQANLLQLHEYARGFDAFQRQGLYRFLRFIDGLRESGRDLDTGSVASPSADVVRVMTIHRSKGLEFPIVILADLGKRFNLRDAYGSILFDRRLGVGMEAVDPDRRIRYPTLPHHLVSEAAVAESLAEEMRVLYVALTRARERLILVGTAPLVGLEEDHQRYAGQIGPLPLLDRQTARNMLSWLRGAICCQPAEKILLPGEATGTKTPLFAVYAYGAEQMKLWAIEPPQRAGVLERYRLCAAAAPLQASAHREHSDAVVDHVARRLITPYPAAALTSVPAVVAASVLKRRWNTMQDQEEPAAPWNVAHLSEETPPVPRHILRRPEFLEQSRPLDPTTVGTLTHEFLQRLDLRRSCDEQDLRAQARALMLTGVFLPAQASAIHFGNIAWLLQTDLGRRMRAENTRLLREWPFVIGVDPRQYEPSASPRSPQDLMLVRGIIDCLFDAGGGWEVLDYKTDAVEGERLASRAAEYRGQLRIYAAAVEETWRKAVTSRWLVFLSARQIVEA